MSRDGVPTGSGTAPKDDVADPHPSTEADYDKVPRPGGDKARKGGADIGPNSYAHDGAAPPRSKNLGADPQ